MPLSYQEAQVSMEHGDRGAARNNVPSPPGWKGERSLELIHQLNERCLELLSQSARADDTHRVQSARDADLGPWSTLDLATRRRVADSRAARNTLSLHGRGVLACISPWNFPLAIFAGQTAAALVAGNCVIAKPAPGTPLVAHAFVKLLHQSGIPRDVLHFAPADGPEFASVALVHPALAGVAFTGSTATATTINQALAAREGPIVPFIAETGAINAMIVDSTALPEQVVDDVITSEFTSAGQRYSALRVLYLQDDIADRVIELLIGAMKALSIGHAADPATDVGPVMSCAPSTS